MVKLVKYINHDSKNIKLVELVKNTFGKISIHHMLVTSLAGVFNRDKFNSVVHQRGHSDLRQADSRPEKEEGQILLRIWEKATVTFSIRTFKPI